jgi:ABC-type bacteriocin/lantibiotic exporter with double-glycine peptidase domain
MIMAQVLTPDSGVVVIPYGRDSVGYIPQRPTLFDRTVLHNMVYPDLLLDESDALIAAKERVVWQTADQLGLRPLLESLPSATGLRTRAGKNGSALSGGQRQAVWLMRMFMQTPKVRVLLMDEPTAAMDPATRVIVASSIRQFGATVVVVTHDMQLVKDVQATRIINIGA